MTWNFNRAWFEFVAARLTELEQEHAARFAGPAEMKSQAEFVKTLFRHPFIVNSMYWHRTDALATAHCFDWSAPLFPDIYLNSIQMLSAGMQQLIAARPYTYNIGSAVVPRENQQILIARLVMLNLEHLLTKPE